MVHSADGGLVLRGGKATPLSKGSKPAPHTCGLSLHTGSLGSLKPAVGSVSSVTNQSLLSIESLFVQA